MVAGKLKPDFPDGHSSLRRLVRHQHWNDHVPKQMLGGAAEQAFAQARMAVTAHDKQIAVLFGTVCEQRIAGRSIALVNCNRFRLDAVAGERERQFRTAPAQRVLVLAILADSDDADPLCLFQQRQRVESSAGRFA